MYEYHRFAGVFEFLEGQEFEDLIKSVKTIGLKQPIWLYQGKILDGRNRYRACLAARIDDPEVKEFEGTDEQALDFVWKINVNRRHLNASQMALALIKRQTLVESLETAATERAEEGKKATQFQPGNEAAKKRSSQIVDLTVLEQPQLTSSQRALAVLKRQTLVETLDSAAAERRPQIELPVPRKDTNAGKVAQQLANMAPGLTNRTYVAEIKKIADEKGIDSPEIQQIASGAKTVPDIIRARKEEKREAVREVNRELVKQAPALVTLEEGRKYSTLLLDPPWDWGDEGDVDQMGRARPTYATMTIDQIANEPVGELAEKNAHIYLWITNRSLPKGFALLEKWGFRYITTITWVKPSFGMGNYFRGSTEQILFGVRGIQPLLRKDVGTHFCAPRGPEHSSKT
jgi:ParB-like chromosome segregation protein Spo0J